MKGMSTHGLLTQITGEEINVAAPKITEFLEKYNYMHIVGNPVLKAGSIKYKYVKDNEPANTVNITYVFIKKDKSKIITSCKISGNAQYLTDFYTTYWPVKTDVNTLKPGKTVYTTFLADRIGIKLLANNKAEINVSSVADVDYTTLNEQKANAAKKPAMKKKAVKK